MSTNALKIFLNSAAAGNIDPVGKYYQYRNQIEAGNDRRRAMANAEAAQRALEGYRQSKLPIDQRKADASYMGSEANRDRVSLDVEKYGNREADELRQLHMKGAGKLDPAGIGAVTSQGYVDPTKFGEAQGSATGRAISKAYKVAHGQAKAGFSGHKAKKVFDAEFGARDPNSTQNRVDSRMALTRNNAAVRTLTDRKSRNDQLLLKLQSEGASPAELENFKRGADKLMGFTAQQFGVDPSALLYGGAQQSIAPQALQSGSQALQGQSGSQQSGLDPREQILKDLGY